MPGESVFAPLTWNDLLYMAPELVLSACFVLLVLLDLFLPRRADRTIIGALTLVSLLSVFAIVLWRMIDMNSGGTAEIISLLGDSYRIDDFGSLLKLLFLAATALIVLIGIGSAKEDNAITDKGEYFYLLLPAVTGAMIMASSGNLITLYVGLELMSITTYVLVGLRRKSSLSAEAAFKYVVTGGISSAFILFGMSYLYGVTGSVQLETIYAALPAALANYEALVYMGFGFMLVGFAVKVAAAPFHAWAPDVYQGAPTPIAAFLAVVSKGAALAVMLRILYATGLFRGTGMGDSPGAGDDLFFALLLAAAAAMLVGTLAALRQMNVKRLLALSGVANAGYMLVPIGLSITMMHSNNVTEFLFYIIAYLLMTVGAFAVLTIVSRAAGHDELSGFGGMYYRAPWTAVAMIVFILSLAGLPISAGFFGKLFILLGAANAKAYWIVAVMVVSSVISYYFYFGIIRQMFMRSAGSVAAGIGSGATSAASSGRVEDAEGIDATAGSSDEASGAAMNADGAAARGDDVRDGSAAAGDDVREGGVAASSGDVSEGSAVASSDNVSGGSMEKGNESVSDENEGSIVASSDNVSEGVAAASGDIRVPVSIGIVIWLCVAGTLALGVFPGLLIEWIDSVFSFGNDFFSQQ